MAVITIKGKNVPKSSCILRDGVYYEKGIDVIKINGRYKIPPRQMDLENTNLKTKTMAVIYDFNINNEPLFKNVEYCSPLPTFPTAITRKFGANYAISEELLMKNGFKECLYDGNFYNDMSIAPTTYTPWKEKNNTKNSKNGDMSYNDRIKYGMYSPTNIINEGKKLWFGVEIETFAGFIPDRILNNFNVKTVKDGSVRDNKGNKYTGAEYVTGVLFGDCGFKHLQDLCFELNKRTLVNKTCGLHVHISGVVFNKDFTIYAYMLGQKIQDELFSMLPKSRLEKNEATGRVYCQKLPKRNFSLLEQAYKENYNEYRKLIEDMYNEIFYTISQEHYPSSSINKTSNSHPGGRWCDPRYYWMNFVGFNFKRENTSDFTMEIRNHSGTTNYGKIKNWILICMAIAYYIENYQGEIINNSTITLADVLNAAYPKTSDSLIEYVESRKQLFETLTNEDKEYKSLDVNNSENKSIKELCV